MQETNSQPKLRLTATVTADHKLVAEVPDDVEPGEVDVVIERRRKPSLERFKRTLSRIDASRHAGRSKEEIDAHIQELRDSWER